MTLKVKERLGPNKVKLSHKLKSVSKFEGPTGKVGWVSTFETREGLKTYRSKSLILTASSHVTATLFGGNNSVLPEAKQLEKIYYPPVASVTVAYPNTAFNIVGGDESNPIVGFGHLIPRAMKIRTLGTIWSSSLFPGRAPPGYTMLLNYIGGAQDSQIKDLSNEDIVKQVDEDIR